MKHLLLILIFMSLFSTFIENTSSNSYAYRASLLDKEIPDIRSLAIDMIKKYEWLRLSAYWDHGACSIWWWTRARSCDESITRQEADRRLGYIVDDLIEDVEKNFPTLHPEGKVALVSFAYNCHVGWKDVKRNGLERHSLWCKKASWVVLSGLVKRRAEESKMIFYP